MSMQGSALSEPSGLWRPTFALWRLENLSSFTQSYTGLDTQDFTCSEHWAPTTWLMNNCKQIMVCSYSMLSNCVWPQMICSRVKIADRLADLSEFKKQTQWSNDKTMLLLNLVIAKYYDLSVSHRSTFCLSLQLWQIIDLLTTDKSQYHPQPHPIIVNYYS